MPLEIFSNFSISSTNTIFCISAPFALVTAEAGLIMVHVSSGDVSWRGILRLNMAIGHVLSMTLWSRQYPMNQRATASFCASGEHSFAHLDKKAG